MLQISHSQLIRLLSVIFIFSFTSCQRSEIESPDRAIPDHLSSEFRVSIEEAAEVATSNPSADSSSAPNARLATGENEILERRTILDSTDNQPLFYIFKKRKGFMIVSADLRVMPVLAYSDKSQIDPNVIPNGVSLWMEMAKEKIREAKRDTTPPHPIVLKEWQKFQSRKLRTSDSYCIEWYQYGQYQCKTVVSQAGPLLTTEWGQEHLSTSQLSTGGDCDGCGRRRAGCGPVAMAQLEEFYHPVLIRPRFSDGICNPTNAGEISLGTLMKNMGTKANASYAYMGTCNTFTWPANVKSGLKNFGFSSGGSNIETYNYGLIKNELKGNHPVIFWGSTCLACFENYHIWVCDGYLENQYSDFNCTTKQCNNWSYCYLHMNWGWGIQESWNGYYAFGQYTANGNDYNGNLHVITGIRP